MNTTVSLSPKEPSLPKKTSAWSLTLLIPAAVLAILALTATIAPLLGTIDPQAFDPISRNKFPGASGLVRLANGDEQKFVFLMGTDSLGRDIYSRVLYGGRASLTIAFCVTLVASVLGVFIGLVSGYIRALDEILMRFMDGFMAIPPILLAIALATVLHAGYVSLIIAIAAPEIPRMARLMRALSLSVREQAFVEAAVTAGTPSSKIMIRHILPNCLAPLIVQASFVCATAILAEASLSFLGVGLPAGTPSWGNVMAQGRQFFRLYPHNIFFPGLFVFLAVLSINLLGDALRDRLDPKIAKKFSR